MAASRKNDTRPRPSWGHVWWTATRPHTLTASLSPCLVAAAVTRPPFHLWLAWTLFCASVQIGTNLHNDYADYVQGADTQHRVGQKRATAQGWLTPTQTCVAASSVLSITFLCGLYLLCVTDTLNNPWLWFLVLSSIFNAFAYTGGPFPLGYLGLGNYSIAYAGLGEVFVFLYFGQVATLFLPYLLQVSTLQEMDWYRQVLYSTQVGLLATNIIVVNNLRDRNTDVAAKKYTTAVRFGRRFCLLEYRACWMTAYALVLVDVVVYGGSKQYLSPRLLPLLSLPMAVREQQAVVSKDGAALNAHVGGAAKVQFLICILLSLGQILSPKP